MRAHPFRKARGVAMLELAIILPLLLLLAFGALEFALAISQYKTLAVQVRIGARYLSSRVPGDAIGRAEAICLVRTGQAGAAPCAGTPVLPGLATATVTVEDAANSAAHKAQASDSSTYRVRVNLVTVKVSGFQYQPILGSFLSGLTGASTITFGPVTATMRQVL